METKDVKTKVLEMRTRLMNMGLKDKMDFYLVNLMYAGLCEKIGVNYEPITFNYLEENTKHIIYPKSPGELDLEFELMLEELD